LGFKWHKKSSTLDDLEGHLQPVRSAILATAGLLVIILLSPSSNERFASSIGGQSSFV